MAACMQVPQDRAPDHVQFSNGIDLRFLSQGVMCGLRTLEDSDSRGEIVDAPGGLESGGDDRGRGDEIVGEAVVQVSLFNR
jgi:hypothetical protein